MTAISILLLSLWGVAADPAVGSSAYVERAVVDASALPALDRPGGPSRRTSIIGLERAAAFAEEEDLADEVDDEPGLATHINTRAVVPGKTLDARDAHRKRAHAPARSPVLRC